MKKLITILRFLSLVVFLILAGNTATAQTRTAGLSIDAEADMIYENLPVMPAFQGDKYVNVALEKSLRSHCPIPGDQGFSGSCVGWACGYGGLTIAKAIQANLTDRQKITEIAHSASFIYNRIRLSNSDCTNGIRITDALLDMRDNGDCLEASFPTATNNCDVFPVDEHFHEAANFKLKDFVALFKIDDSPSVKIDQTIKMLASDNPVIAGLQVTASFWDLKKEDLPWRPTPSDPQLGDPPMGGHAVVVVGYNKYKEEFELMNSYGPNWGDEGFFRMSFQDYGKMVKYAFHIAPEDNLPIEMPSIAQPVSVKKGAGEKKTMKGEAPMSTEKEERKNTLSLKGSFSFRNVSGNKMEDAAVKYNAKHKVYELLGDWRLGATFQLVAKEISKGSSVYVFSINSKNEVNIHFPRQLKLESADQDNETETYSEQPIIPSEDAEILIPSPNTGLELDVAGEDNLCVLYCRYPIRNLGDRLVKMEHSKGSIASRLSIAFGDLFVPDGNTTYEKDKMIFQSKQSGDEKFVVPVVLSVVAKP
ncbi:MAG: C1 family peptidase [Saprospiraceae bacterium]|nr:C1 family peptidase [Saprospiraceae bacterium]